MARALGLTKGTAARTPLGKWQAMPDEKAGRRPGHKRAPYVPDNEASLGEEGPEGDEDDVEEEPPAAKRQRTAPEAADSPDAPGDDLPQGPLNLACICICSDAVGSKPMPAPILPGQRKVSAMCTVSGQ